MLLPVKGPKRGQLVVLVDLILAARRVVPQIRQEILRRSRTVRIQRAEAGHVLVRVVVAERSEPPETILDEGPTGVHVRIVEFLQRRILDSLRTKAVSDVVARKPAPI